MEIKDFKNACDILGIDFKDFIETNEVEKSVEDIDYKKLYENQKELNNQILGNILEISKSFDHKLEEFKESLNIKEIQKSYDEMKKKVDNMKNSPVHNRKSVTNVNVIEKAVGENKQQTKNRYSLQDFNSRKRLKQYLGDKALEELQKGVQNSIYEQAALQLDAYNRLHPNMIQTLFDKDNIIIE